MPEAVSPNTPSRRAVFTCAGALLAGAAAVALAPHGAVPQDDSELIAVAGELERWETMIFKYDRDILALTEQEVEDLLDRCTPLLERIKNMRPNTLAGCSAKAQAIAAYMRNVIQTTPGQTFEEQAEGHEILAFGLMNDLAKMTGELEARP